MKQAPALNQIKEYFLQTRPLAIGDSGSIEIEDIDPKPWSGHFNYLVSDGDKRAVLRIKGPEWGDEKGGILNEYRNLKTIESIDIAPKPLWLDEDGINSEPLMLVEYLKGEVYSGLSLEKQREFWPQIAQAIFCINNISPQESGAVFGRKINSYSSSISKWQERLGEAKKWGAHKEWVERIENIMPRAKKALYAFDKTLKEAIEKTGPAFIYESAHSSHCLVTSEGIKFINWEDISYGDPSYTLAVFIESYAGLPCFNEAKELLIKSYLSQKDIPHFTKLIEQRLIEREIANLGWVLWAYAKKSGDMNLIDQNTSIKERYERVLRLLKEGRV